MVSQIAPPLTRGSLASLVKGWVLRMLATSLTAAMALTTEISPMREMVATLSHRLSRSMRPGSPMIKTPSNTAITTR